MRLEGRRVFRPRRRVQRESSLSTFDRNSLPTRFLRSENVSNGFVRSFDDAIARDQESATQNAKESEVFLTGAEVIQERTSPPVFSVSFFRKGSKIIRLIGTIENYTLCQKRIILEPFCYFRLYRREERRIRPSNQRGRLVRCIRRSCSIMTAGECLCRARDVDVFLP